MAYDLGEIDLHTAIIVRRFGEFEGEPITQRINTTVGRMIFNSVMPEGLGYIERNTPEDMLKKEK